MSDSIKYDHKFVRLLNRFLAENKEIMASKTFQLSRRFYDTMGMSIDFVNFDSKIKRLEEQSSITLKHIFKYIDRRVECAVNIARVITSAEEVCVGPLAKMQRDIGEGCYKAQGENVYHTITSNDENDFHFLIKKLKNELFRINNLIILLPKCKICLGYSSSKIVEISIEFNVDHLPQYRHEKFNKYFQHESDKLIINVTLIAKYFSDELNRIAREEYDSRTI